LLVFLPISLASHHILLATRWAIRLATRSAHFLSQTQVFPRTAHFTPAHDDGERPFSSSPLFAEMPHIFDLVSEWPPFFLLLLLLR